MTRFALLAAALLAGAAPLAAQTKTTDPKATKPADHGAHHKAESGKDHANSGWKELDGYHQLMMTTWHPASAKNDLAPIREHAAHMADAAKLLAASKGPKGCDTPAVKSATAKLLPATQGVADLVARKADDATVKAALKALHDSFETVEGCASGGHGTGHDGKHHR